MSNKYNLGDPSLNERIAFPVGLRIEDCYLRGTKKHPANHEGTKDYGVSIEFEFHYLPADTSAVGYGAILKHREFDPEGSTNIQVDEARLAKGIKLTMSRIKHILGCYIDEEKVNSINVNSFEELCDKIENSQILKNSQNVKTALKTVYNKSNMVSLPNVPDFISTDKKPREFKADPNWDYFEKRQVTPNTYSTTGGGGSYTPPTSNTGGSADVQEEPEF